MRQEEVVEAAKQACCHDFIMSLPQGYQTVVNEKEIIFQVVKTTHLYCQSHSKRCTYHYS